MSQPSSMATLVTNQSLAHENREWSVSQKELMGDNDHHHHHHDDGNGPHGTQHNLKLFYH